MEHDVPLESLPAVRALLRFGYAIEWHGDPGARTCIVSDPDETWEGRGTDEKAALEDALAKLAPSKIARALIDKIAAQIPAQTGSAEMRLAGHRTGTDTASGTTTGPRDSKTILSDLETVAARVHAGIPEAALMAPTLQKLHVLAWIARARALEQEAGRARPISDATGAIARRLTLLCKTWWPGSVRALQLDATPERAAREQGLPPALRWIEVAQSAEAKLEQTLADSTSDDGWRDTVVMEPPPAEPGHEVAFAARTIERLIAPLDTPPSGEPPATLSSSDELQLEDAAARLRWARHVTPDPERWGAAFGRLRWLVAHRRGGARLPKLLDPNYVPRPSWSDEAQTARTRLLALTPPPDRAPELTKWLLATFDAIPGPALAERLKTTVTVSGQPVLPFVLGLREGDLPRADRRMRRRLRQLQSLLRGGDANPFDAPEITGENVVAITRSEVEELAPAIHPDEAIFARVRLKLSGVTALFVSNREDPQLRERLEKALGWSSEWTTAETRRVSSIASAIARGKYRVVLSATGFQDHSTDIALARAAGASNTLYVRVNRGRVAACARALARELGIRVEDSSLETPTSAAG